MNIERSKIRQERGRSLNLIPAQSLFLNMQPSVQHSASSPHRIFIEVSTELLRQGQRVRFKAPGRSMNPTINEGETITIQPAAPSAVSKGDIILYSFGRGFIAHRVLRILRREGDSPCFIMRGDASGSSDYPVAAQQVLGKVISVERGGRSIDLYSKRARIRHIAHRCASRLKRWMVRVFFECEAPFTGGGRAGLNLKRMRRTEHQG